MVLHNLFIYIIHYTWRWVAFSYFQKSDSKSKDKDTLRIYFTVFYIASKANTSEEKKKSSLLSSCYLPL